MDKTAVMSDMANSLISMINGRLQSRVKAHETLCSTIDNAPEEVKKMREVEAGKIRAVMQEQADLIEIIKLLYPPAPKLLGNGGESER